VGPTKNMFTQNPLQVTNHVEATTMPIRNCNEFDGTSSILDVGLSEREFNNSILWRGRVPTQEIGLPGQYQLPSSIQSNGILLGRATDPSKLVLWEPSGIGRGSSLGLLVESFGVGTVKMSGSARMLSKLSKHTRYKLSCISAVRCVNYISYIFDAGGNVVFMPNEVNTCIDEMLMGVNGADKIPASSLGPIQFIGGPPGNRNFTTGSLLTVLEDLILLSMCGNQTHRIERLEEAMSSIT